MVRRNISEVWAAVKEQKPAELNYFQWKQSQAGVAAALMHVGLVLVTSKTVLDSLPVPEVSGMKQYMARKVVVTRDGIQSPPTCIRDLLNGHSSLPTPSELAESHRQRGLAMSDVREKGVDCSHAVEMQASNDLAEMLELGSFLRKVVLLEGRLADQAYCHSNDDMHDKVFVADQEKSACESPQGQLAFNYNHTSITFDGMLQILETGYSLTMIGRRKSDGKPDVIWLFFGPEAISALQTLPPKLPFSPRLHLKKKSTNPATVICNRPLFRFDVGSSDTEVVRLRDRRIQIVEQGEKHTLKFLNEHMSQIPSPNGKTEHRSFLMTRAACASLSAEIEHFAEDSYTLTDFRLDKTCRIQDRVTRDNLYLRSPNGHPMNPDKVDILQITSLKEKTVYAVPFRVRSSGAIVSFFTEEQLMKRSIWLSAAFKETLAPYLCDLKDPQGTKKYIDICQEAQAVPPMSDSSFHDNIIANNAEMFGTKQRYPRK